MARILPKDNAEILVVAGLKSVSSFGTSTELAETDSGFTSISDFDDSTEVSIKVSGSFKVSDLGTSTSIFAVVSEIGFSTVFATVVFKLTTSVIE